MMRDAVQRAVRRFGYEVQKVNVGALREARPPAARPARIEPVWPLPRADASGSDAEIRRAFEKFDSWQYAFRFDGGLDFRAHHKGTFESLRDAPERPLQRFRHFMPYVVAAAGGSLEGKRVLDVSCNSGFWSMQCALLGAEVVGFDVRPENIEQANLVKSIVGAENASFQVLDFWDMSPEVLGGTFDVVLNLGLLYHLAKPLEALELTKTMSRKTVLLDTGLFRSDNPVLKLRWEVPHDIQMAGQEGVVAFPSKTAVELMLHHAGYSDWFEIPLRSDDVPPDYRNGRRASWLITV